MTHIFRISTFLFLLLFGDGEISKIEQYLISHPIWLNENIRWIREEGETGLSSQNRGLIAFRSNHTFFFTTTRLLKSKETDSVGIDVTGWCDYDGTWKVDSNRILLNYRLIDKQIRRVGENVPGDIILDTLTILHCANGYTFDYSNDSYKPFDKLLYEERARLLSQ